MKVIASIFPKEDAELFYLLYKIGNGGITPWYDFQKKSMRQSKFHTVCKLLWMPIYLYCILAIFSPAEEKSLGWTVMKTLNALFRILKCCTVLNYVICLYSKTELWAQFLRSFCDLHEIMRKRNMLTKNIISKLSLSVMVLCATAYVLVVIIYFIIMNFNLMTIAMVFVVFYCIMLENCLMCMACLCLKRRYRDLNRHLESSVGGSPRSTEAMVKEHLSATDVRDAGKMYKKLAGLVHVYNSLFGWKIMYLLAISFFEFLERISNIVKGTYQFSDVVGFYLTLIMGTSLSVVLSCDGVTVEGRKLSSLCCELQERRGVHAMVKEELQILAEMAELHTPTLTAGDFFEVDRKTILALLSTATTYMIVVVQLNSNFNKKTQL